MRQLSALVFDAYGTLFDVHSVIQAAETQFPGRGTALSQLWRAKQLEYSWLRSLMQTDTSAHVDFNHVTQDALLYACESLKLDFSAATLTMLKRAYRTLDAFADARELLAALAADETLAKLKLAILSNGAPDMLQAVVAHNRVENAFDAILSVEDAGVYKPDPRVYHLAVTRLGCPADEIGFVSSNGWDAAGAKAFGFTVFWVNRAKAPTELLGETPDHVIGSLTELPALIR
jgi:2-haloacid dehalogenase